jgi:2,4-dienoyl-CoA reductase-like NADH-dependent reductase (Old Yellow Enzyme family)
MILGEATSAEPMGVGYPSTPGIWSKDQIEGWKTITAGEADAVAFGKAFIANPDLPGRFAYNAPLNTWNSETFYTAGPEGYTDHPAVA